ncbi:helix-turn-helix domain-containing protein [Sinorhizobium americanum]|uniref:AraC-like DNA-binding protein n=1 Tax=Sinorhizobium americanum TaxID=194963 RepID=A0A4R2BNM8_9HYPH|nr:helix-turn-helix domain-containing protein [Sinorhizobium americanum]TCN29021.1 AraC-like DNA-binding protein [Sinorhizobium americanum]
MPNITPPRLAQSTGIYRERPAAGALAAYFKCLWLHRLPDGEAPSMAVVPDGCADIIWTSGGPAIVGPDRVAAFPKLAAGETIFGARFRIGAAAVWLRTPLSALTGRTVPLDLLWGRTAGEMDERMALASDASERLAILANALREHLSTAHPPPPNIASLVKHLHAARPAAADPIRNLARTAGLSERSLRRLCLEHFGYGAKALDRVLRLQRFLAAGRGRPQDKLAALAVDAGYADQAHLTREMRELTSLTPGEILRQLAPGPSLESKG